MGKKKQRVKEIAACLDFAFQPIVSAHSGITLGFEALVRNLDSAGFSNINELFDWAYENKLLYQLDLVMRELAIQKFASINIDHDIKVFYNIDNRLLLMPDYTHGNTEALLKKHDLHQSQFCFEISEKLPITADVSMKKILRNYKNQGFFIAIDDYGAGFSGLKQLYKTEPDYLKIDSFFINGINLDGRKKLFLANIVNLAHIIGLQVIAEGVETKEEFTACREIGCEFIQGYFVQKPQVDVSSLQVQYEIVEETNESERRKSSDDSEMILLEMQRYEPIVVETSTTEDILNYFRRHSHKTFVPIVNAFDAPIGVVRENILKKYVYSPYGKELLRNKNIRGKIKDLVTNAPVCELSTSIEKIIEIYNINRESIGILLTENGKYRGFLTARALLKLINEKNIAFARSQNPLTRLPGNLIITKEIAQISERSGSAVCYFDFDNFKPFNDKYGFRIGDRAIIMFAEILTKYSSIHSHFIGHVGGDDFVMLAYNINSIDVFVEEIERHVIKAFKNDVETLYNENDRKKGCIEGTDRYGIQRSFPLLTVSCVIFNIERNSTPVENIPAELARLKKEAKKSENSVIIY